MKLIINKKLVNINENPMYCLPYICSTSDYIKRTTIPFTICQFECKKCFSELGYSSVYNCMLVNYDVGSTHYLLYVCILLRLDMFFI